MKLKAGYLFFLATAFLLILFFFQACRAPGQAKPVRAYLFAGEPTPQGYGAYGYLVLNAQPSAEDEKRYERICQTYKRGLVKAAGDLPEERTTQMATFWPLNIKRVTGIDDFSCQRLLESYDYAKASEISSAVRKLAVRGPVLAAWTKPFEEIDSSKEGLVLDLSDFADEDLDRALGIWRDRITRDPATWVNGFDLVRCREAFRSLLQKYGDTILAVVHPVKSKS